MHYNRDWLYLHVVGSGVGEGTLVYLPSVGWGLIDCGLGSLNSLSAFLDERHIETIEFVAVTHPHEDHIGQLAEFIRCYSPRRAWKHAGHGQTEFLQIQRDRSRGGPGMRRGMRIVGFLNAIDANIGGGHKWSLMRAKYPPMYETLHLPEGEEEHQLARVVALSPDDAEEERYFAGLRDLMSREGFQWRKRDYLINGISSVIALRYGETRVLLGADLPHEMSKVRVVDAADQVRRGWRRIVDKASTGESDPLFAHVVKVSHHGSPTSYLSDAWERHSRRGHALPTAIVTAFNKCDLPDKVVLDLISQFSEKVLVVGGRSSRSAPVESLRGAGFGFAPGQMEIVARRYANVGSVTIAYDWCGTCRETVLNGMCSDMRVPVGGEDL